MNTPITVFHNNPIWLHLTENWIYRQIKFLPDDITPHVICEKTINAEQFPVPYLHVLSADKWHYFWERVQRKLGWHYSSAFMVKKTKQHKADILHSHFGPRGWFNLETARIANLKHVVTFYGYDVNALPLQKPFWLERYQILFQKVNLVLCEGPHMRQMVIQLGCPAEKVKVLHLGVDVDQISYQPREWRPGEPLKILLAASFVEKKGLPYALEALAHLQHEVNLQITIIGDARQEASSLAEKQKILAILNSSQLASKTRLLGYQPQATLFEEAYHHHLFLSPSVTAESGDTEGGAPVSIIDMAATGMPIVSTTHCDIPEVVKHEKTGLLAGERDVGGLIHHLRWLIQNPHAFSTLGKAGRLHMEQEFNASLQSQKLAQYYRLLLE